MAWAEFTEHLRRSADPKNEDLVSLGIVAAAVGRNGKQIYFESAGGATGNSLWWFASQGKLFAVAAALQAVERGLIGLDDDVAPIVPELAALQVLDGERPDGTLKTRPRRNKITLRLLLSHQSGLGYSLTHPILAKWEKEQGLEIPLLNSDFKSFSTIPLLFEPGTSWAYGAGIDWAGEVVARLNKTTLEEYMKKNVWGPLSLTSTTYHPERLPDWEQRKPQICQRNEDGRGVTPSGLHVKVPAPHDCAGHGIFSTANDYMKLLSALLNDGGPLLSKASVDEMIRPELNNPDSIYPGISGSYRLMYSPSIPKNEKIDHSLAGLYNLNDFKGARKAGTIQWSGGPNLIWWVDRSSGVAGAVFMNLFPTGDAKAAEFNLKFEHAVYATI